MLSSTRFAVHSTLEGVKLKHATREALRYFIAERPDKADIEAIYLHTDGGGERTVRGQWYPATWAVKITSKANYGTLAFYGYVCGRECTAAGDNGYHGAEQATSMTAECTAQLVAALVILANPLEVYPSVGVTVIYDNEIAARFSRAVAKSGKNVMLAAVLASVWQIATIQRSVEWVHAYSHMGEPMNELADSLVAHAAINPTARTDHEQPCALWCRHYKISQIKLLYLVRLPQHLRYAYPKISEDATAIEGTPQNRIKWGLPTAELSEILDVQPQRRGGTREWVPEPVSIGTYNSCTTRGDGAMTSMST